MEQIPLAKEHLVCKSTSVDPSIKCSEIVASTDVEKVSSSVMYSMVDLVSSSLPNYEFTCAANIVDAHSSNWSALYAKSTHSASQFLPNELMSEFPLIDFSIVHITVDVVTGKPIVNMPNPVHYLKNIVFTLEILDFRF